MTIQEFIARLPRIAEVTPDAIVMQSKGAEKNWFNEIEDVGVCRINRKHSELQELKSPQAKIPAAAIEQAGYGAIRQGEKSWNGVAILAKGSDHAPVRIERSQGPPKRSRKAASKPTKAKASARGDSGDTFDQHQSGSQLSGRMHEIVTYGLGFYAFGADRMASRY